MGTVLAFSEGDTMMHPLFGEIEALGPWTAHIQAMDQAVSEDAPGESVRAWRQAYSAALSHPGRRDRRARRVRDVLCDLRERCVPPVTARPQRPQSTQS